MKNLNSQKGIIALLAVIIIGAAALIMSRSIMGLGLDKMESDYILSKGGEAMAIADGCAEESLRRLQLDNNYETSEKILNLGQGKCIINLGSSGNDKIINISAQVGSYYKKIQLKVLVASSTISIINWQEI